MNPLSDPMILPAFAEMTPEAITTAVEEAIIRHRQTVSDIAGSKPTSFEEAWLPLERANTFIDALWNSVSHLSSVTDSADLRSAEAEGRTRIVANGLEVAQNQDLYRVLVSLAATPSFNQLPDQDKTAVEQAIRNFRLAGVALETEARDHFREITVRISKLETEFSNAVLDATDAWFEHIEDEATLVGISASDKLMLAQNARERSLEGWVVTLQQPCVSAIMRSAERRDLRYRVYEAFGTRASDQGPHAGRFDNSERIAAIVSLRQEAAELLSYSDAVSLSLETKMAESAAEILAFLRDLGRRARPAAEKDLAELRAFALAELEIPELEPWDMSFASEKLRLTKYAIDQHQVRSFFPVDKVIEGWGWLLDRLFGIRLCERADVALYHADARYYDVLDEAGELIAGMYLDLHARSGKRGGAWMSEARPRLNDGNSVRVPVAYLTCNFSPANESAPALLTHDDIITLLHETGHVLHHLFTKVDRPSIGGINGFEWDAIELPSQLLEDFAWDHDVLTGMSGHVETGIPLPRQLFERLLASQRFQSGLAVLRHVEFAMFDILLHLGSKESDVMSILNAVRDEVAVMRPPEWHRFPHAFTHIFSSGYAAGYYSYLWAEVLAADGFQKFEETGPVDRAIGNLLREEVLSKGASRPAAESFRRFRGRDADPEAMLARNGLL